MIKIESYHNQIVEIERFQSTYIILKIGNKLLRFDFKNKKEAFLKQKEIGKLIFHEKHHLLINHNENNLEVFINSKPENSEIFTNDIMISTNEITKGWRNWKDYIEINTGINDETFLHNIEKGAGKIMKAPFSIVENIEKLCDKHQVKIKCFGKKTLLHTNC